MTLCLHCHHPQSHRRHDPRDGEFHAFEARKEEEMSEAKCRCGDAEGDHSDNPGPRDCPRFDPRQETDEVEQGLPVRWMASDERGTGPVDLSDLLALLPKLSEAQKKAIRDAIPDEYWDSIRTELKQERDAAIANAVAKEQKIQELMREVREADDERDAAIAWAEKAENISEHQAKMREEENAAYEIHLSELKARISELESRLHEKQVAYTEVHTKWQDAERRRDVVVNNFVNTVALNRKLSAQAADVARRQREACANKFESHHGAGASLARRYILETPLVTDSPPTRTEQKRPPPPDELVGALHDKVHEEGKLIAAHPIKTSAKPMDEHLIKALAADLDAANARIAELEKTQQVECVNRSSCVDEIERLRAKCSRQRREILALNRKILEVRGAQVWWLNLPGSEKAAGGASYVWLRKQYKHYQELSRQQAEELSALRAKEAPEKAWERMRKLTIETLDGQGRHTAAAELREFRRYDYQPPQPEPSRCICIGSMRSHCPEHGGGKESK